MEPVVLFTLGDEEFTLKGLTVQEMAKVKTWTSFPNRPAWFEGLRTQDPQALIAGYMLVKLRKGEKLRFEDADFNLDDFDAKWVDEAGREVEPLLEKNKDGSVKRDKDGDAIPVLDAAGRGQWVYTDTGDAVPPPDPAT